MFQPEIAEATIARLPVPLSEPASIGDLCALRDDLAKAIVRLRGLDMRGASTAELYEAAKGDMGRLLAEIVVLCAKGIV